MPVAEASLNTTLRTIAVLLVLWWLIRLYLRSKARAAQGPREPSRPRGEVRIERAPQDRIAGKGGRGDIIDADFEEIK